MATTKKKPPDEETLYDRLDAKLDNPIIPHRVREWLSCGCDLVDWVIGNGFPMGRFIELYGDFSAGKDLIAYGLMRGAQRAGGRIFFIDTEAKLDLGWMQSLGVSADKEHFYWRIPSYLEEIHDLIQGIVTECKDSDTPTIVVWNSIAATLTKKMVERDSHEDSSGGMMRAAQLNSIFLAGLALKQMYNSKIILLGINQLRDKPAIGTFHVSEENKESTPGGRGKNFYATVRLRLKKIKDMEHDKGTPPPGKYVEIKAIKNNVGREGRNCQLPFWATIGLDNRYALLNYIELNSEVIAESATMTDLQWNKGRFYWNGKSWTKTALWQHLVDVPTSYEEFRRITKELFFRHERRA